MLRSRRSRGEEALDTEVFGPIGVSESNPEQEALLADSVGVALLAVLDTLSPAERVAFVLHDVFDLSFDEIAPIVDRTPEAARQLASRARRRVRGGGQIPDSDLKSQRVVVDAFLAAFRAGDFEGLLAVLDPDVGFRAVAAAGDSRCEELGERSHRIFAVCPIHAAGHCKWSSWTGVRSARSTVKSSQFHDSAWEDRPGRSNCRSGAGAPTRPGGPQ